jgi:hypothetical protein
MLVGGEESVTAFAEVSASGAAVLADDSILTHFFSLADFSVVERIFTLANFSALVALGHLLTT